MKYLPAFLMMVGGALLLIPHSTDKGPEVRGLLTDAYQADRQAKIDTLKFIDQTMKDKTAEERVREWARKQESDFDRIFSPVADVAAAALHNNTQGDLAREWEKQ